MTIFFVKYFDMRDDATGTQVHFFKSYQEALEKVKWVKEETLAVGEYSDIWYDKDAIGPNPIQWHLRDVQYLIEKLNEINKIG